MTTERERDELLVKRAQAGDQVAFDLLVSKYRRRIIRLVTGLVHNSMDAEDISQETFFKAFQAIHCFRNESAFYTWLYRIGVNTAKNFLAGQNRLIPSSTKIYVEQPEMSSDLESLDIETPESVLASKQIAHRISTAFDGLPPELQMVISLYEIEGLSYDQISEVMGCATGTVRSRIFRAREVIAKNLKPLLDVPIGCRW